MGTSGRHGDADTPCAASDLGADLEELEADGSACGSGEAGSGERDAPQGGEQDIGHGSEPEAELVGAHGGCGGMDTLRERTPEDGLTPGCG